MRIHIPCGQKNSLVSYVKLYKRSNVGLKAYVSDTSNEYDSNLSSEQDGDSTKFQKVDVESNV
ncbi:hypothetical protein CFP56_007406 [Quercus suber]|uniref:Uncharacterized protein n=1 Tax=Quercus suber TaxID=58331 RepID=A0AAW0L7G3_QUESU